MTEDKALKQALLNLEVDANAIFNNPTIQTPQDVRDVINWYAESIRRELMVAVWKPVPARATGETE